METETVLAELAKINDRLDEMSEKIENIKSEMFILKKLHLNDSIEKCFDNVADKYKYPTEEQLDAEEAKELKDAKKNASAEWRTLRLLENTINLYKRGLLF